MPVIPVDEIGARVRTLRERMAGEGLDGALLHGTSNLYYFAGTAQQAHLWVPQTGEPVLLVRRVLERARLESGITRIEALASLRDLPAHLGDARRIGMELDILPVSLYERYRAVLPALQIVDVGPLSRLIRSVKSAHELALVRAAAVAADATFTAVRTALREGISELELSVVAESTERRNGFQGMLRWRAAVGFECPWVHVLSGPSALDFSFSDTPFGGQGLCAAAPYGASRRVIGRGEPVCLDFALARDGYIHDMTRTLSVGRLPQALLDAYERCRDIQQMIREEARPGVTGGELWDRSVAIAEDAGLGEHFMGHGEQRVRFVGHGVGLELDELPVLAPRQRQPLESGHVIAVEPKFFFPGVGAVGLENTFAVHPDHVETITLSPEDIAVVE